ncbi:MAG: hypothetical protein HUU15_09295 [Candidatus Brocadiae bacterium]|nr:hypothetical protein [Candidatus Brocadiia bacterium]
MKRTLPLAAFLTLAAAAANEDLGPRFQVFPPDNPWHWDISRFQVDPGSDAIIDSIGRDRTLHPDFGTQYGIPYVVVPGNAKKQKIVEWEYPDESDKEPYPIPADPPIEGGKDSDGDRHVIMIDRDNRVLYELYHVFPVDKGGWKAGSGAIWDLKTNDRRRDGWTSADAAGLAIFPGLVRYEEVERGAIDHAIRFTARRTRKEYWFPASHHAGHGTEAALPPMGCRVRLKASFEIKGFPKEVETILRALKKHGMILADNGSDWFLSGAPDKRWDDEKLRAIKKLKGSDFEVVKSVDEKGKPIAPPGVKIR